MSEALVLFGVAIGGSIWSLLMVLVGWAMAKTQYDQAADDEVAADV